MFTTSSVTVPIMFWAVIKHLSRMCRVLGSIPSIAKKGRNHGLGKQLSGYTADPNTHIRAVLGQTMKTGEPVELTGQPVYLNQF